MELVCEFPEGTEGLQREALLCPLQGMAVYGDGDLTGSRILHSSVPAITSFLLAGAILISSRYHN